MVAGPQENLNYRPGKWADLIQNYDRLGPLTRAVIAESPIEIAPVGRMIAAAPMELFNPNTGRPDDKRMAKWLSDEIRSRYHRPAEYFALVPRRLERR
jgi:hypothetical protein